MKKVLILTLALVLAIGLGIGITLAYLYTDTTPLVNTFEYGDVNIKLEETTTTYKMIPGNTIAKDPTVTVLKDSEPCWLFVKIEKSANFDTFMTYGIAEDWIPFDGVSGVYYREVGAADADIPFPVLAGKAGYANGYVTVRNSVTKQMLGDGFTAPTLTFTAYAVQKANVTSVADAWALVGTKGVPTT